MSSVCNLANDKVVDVLAYTLNWLRARVPATANVHADSRAVQSGDIYLSYAVTEEEQRRYFGEAIKRGAGAILWQPGQSESAPIGLVGAENFAVPTLAILTLLSWRGRLPVNGTVRPVRRYWSSE